MNTWEPKSRAEKNEEEGKDDEWKNPYEDLLNQPEGYAPYTPYAPDNAGGAEVEKRQPDAWQPAPTYANPAPTYSNPAPTFANGGDLPSWEPPPQNTVPPFF